ncbi:hypothetical protein SLEP1_g34532 [Rubroshorea leprosula]|uniref:Uncharacterized protein n=1 Tax=Rubroshorea leprosula TaxID=152421 RepID=A0AAV5KKI8_9ROSI|nr:hypothetical protein SLEP1_g34532 [Rubroshorea leprosula]
MPLTCLVSEQVNGVNYASHAGVYGVGILVGNTVHVVSTVHGYCS